MLKSTYLVPYQLIRWKAKEMVLELRINEKEQLGQREELRRYLIGLVNE